MAELGTLLKLELNRLARHAQPARQGNLAVAACVGDPHLPVVLQVPPVRPGAGETWPAYRLRVQRLAAPLQEKIAKLTGSRLQLSPIANALSGRLTVTQIHALQVFRDIAWMELDPARQVVYAGRSAAMNLDMLQWRPTWRTGKGVRLAVLDSGIDCDHPWLQVLSSVETCGESTAVPGVHGTFCAGLIASRDPLLSGLAPEVDLLNVKVLHADGVGHHAAVTRGIDAALDQNAHIISLSLGFNHLPTTHATGHGWTCAQGLCTLCTAVNNAVLLDNTLVVTAAGNNHCLLKTPAGPCSTAAGVCELSCPGNAASALTVGAVADDPPRAAGFSSHGPTPYGLAKPDLAAPGVAVAATLPVPRDASGKPLPNPPRDALVGCQSGTSVATALVAGFAALVLQKYLEEGRPWTASGLKQEILTHHTKPVEGASRWAVGVGRLYANPDKL